MGSGLQSRRRPHAAGLLRAALAAVVAAGLSAVPIVTVMACDCMFTELPEAVRDADVAIVGTLVGAAESAVMIDRGGPPERVWTWEVERSRDTLDGTTLDVHAWDDDGANCGVSFAVGERWLVLAHAEDGRLLTNSCSSNQRLDGSNPDGEAVITSLLPAVANSPSSTGGSPLPVPVLVATGVAVLMGIIGAAAFRTRRDDPVS
jgi:hypothetical protein